MPTGVLSQHIQDGILKLQINDDEFLKLTRSVVEPKHFTAPETENICKIIYGYFDKYRESPKDHFREELRLHLDYKNAPDEQVNIYIHYLENLKDYKVNKEYILDMLSTFVKRSNLREAAIKFAELTTDEKFDEAEDLMRNALKQSNGGIKVEPISSDTNMLKLREFIKVGMQGLKTGFNTLDEATGGLDGIVILAGQPASGKSALALNISVNVAMKGTPVVYFDYENEQCKTMAKLLSITEGISYRDLNAKFFENYDFKGKKPEGYITAGNLIHLIENRKLTLDKTKPVIERIMEQHNTDKVLVVVDSIQKAPLIGGRDSRRDAIDLWLRQAEDLKKAVGVKILGISEYRRMNGGYPDKPTMDMLKESGDIEYSADIILAFAPPRQFNDVDKTGREMNLHCLKNRYTDFSNERIGATYRLIYPYWQFEEKKDLDTGILTPTAVRESFHVGRN